ncbi:MAG TPA: hypothetical protein VKB39_09780, partial [Candidatus Baltobacteraceae bacterium]|nr:hypothetical protein [Candidatus Baltobacteraceae bacterium]
MMTQQLNVCVLAAPLAAIDRRALSQAWYSALNCASNPKGEIKARTRLDGGSLAGKRSAAQTLKSEHGKLPGARREDAPRGTSAKALPPGGDLEAERRARRSPLARRIERKLLDPRSTPQRASFSTGGKRVHVVVQASAGRVNLVAVCHPAVREVVLRALA